ncbi:hypothetical protein GCM10029964_115730 [Kibdelosporangium lantanae]
MFTGDWSTPASATGHRAAEPLGSGPMASPAEIERKVRQLDNDVQSIYEMLATIEATQKRQGNRLNEIVATQTEHGEKLDTILDLLRRNQSE